MEETEVGVDERVDSLGSYRLSMYMYLFFTIDTNRFHYSYRNSLELDVCVHYWDTYS